MKTFFYKSKYLLLLIFFPLFLVSCGQETLHEGLSEKDANKMQVVLGDHGINATKSKVASAQDVSFSVLVSEGDLTKSRQILTDYNLPRTRNIQKMIEDICTAKDVISSPEWEKCRETVSKQGQISQHLESDAVPAVVKADVIISVPKKDEFGEEPDPNKKTTASAVVRMIRTDSDDKITEEDIKRYISNAVDNLAFRDVSVIVSYIDDPKMSKGVTACPEVTTTEGKTPGAVLTSLLGLEMRPVAASRLKIYLIVFLVLFIAIGAVLVLNVIKMTKLRQELKVSKANLGDSALPAGESPPSIEEPKEGGEKPPEQLPPAEEDKET